MREDSRHASPPRPAWRFASALCAVALSLLLVSGCSSGSARSAGKPARTETLAAGPYTVDVSLYADPPITDRSVKLTVAPHAAHLVLAGYVVVFPGPGTDAVPIRSALSRATGGTVLIGSIHIPVRGAWELRVQLRGPRGAGDAMFPITAAAPGAIPVWLAWMIGATPLLILAWLIWHAAHFRQRLLIQQEIEAQAQ